VNKIRIQCSNYLNSRWLANAKTVLSTYVLSIYVVVNSKVGTKELLEPRRLPKRTQSLQSTSRFKLKTATKDRSFQNVPETFFLL